MNICKVCGVNPAPKPKYYRMCGSCRNKKYGKRKPCIDCGKPCEAGKGGKRCWSCHVEYTRRFHEERICKKCGKTYKANRHEKFIYCSIECYASVNAAKFRLGGDNALSWKGEVGIENGYPIAYDSNRKRRVHIHIQKAEKVLGRRLKKGECVHHIDMDRTNSANSNLLICDRRYHVWLHHEMQLQWVKKVLKAGR